MKPAIWEGTVDWDRFRGLLRGIGYSGSGLREADIRHSQFRDHAVFASQA